ncbi:MAG: nuclear transport factor 2 family protein [Acidobacteria bacterium]|nr:nuclear transport factor 2 family protein [Acidobacteriota bacterium]
MKNLILVTIVLGLFSLGCSGILRSINSGNRRIQSYGDNEANGSPVVDPVEAQFRDQMAELVRHARLSCVNGDRSEADRLFTDDYVGVYDDGDRISKKYLLDHIHKDTDFISLTVENSRILSHDQTTAQLQCTLVGKFTDQNEYFDGVYSFVNKRGYWQISGFKGHAHQTAPDSK